MHSSTFTLHTFHTQPATLAPPPNHPTPAVPICYAPHALHKHAPPSPTIEICEISAYVDDDDSPPPSPRPLAPSPSDTPSCSSYSSYSPFSPPPTLLPHSPTSTASASTCSPRPHPTAPHAAVAFLHQLSLPTSRHAFFTKSTPLDAPLCWELSDFLSCSSHTLRVLTLSSTPLPPTLLSILLPAIASCRCLSTLDLPGASLSDAAAALLSDMLRSNSSITELQLSRNEIGDEGAAALAGAMRCNTTLATINLSHNCISDRGCRALLGAAGGSVKSLQVMPGNSISAHVAAEVARRSPAGLRVMRFFRSLAS